MTSLDKRGRDLLAQVWGDIQRRNRDIEFDAARRDPEKHRLTRVMSSGAHTGYTYWRGATRRLSKNREERTRFCVATCRNAAGFFLLWRQVDRLKLKRGRWVWFESERFDFKADETKKELRRIAQVKADRDKAEWAHKCASRLPDAPAEVK